jgi:molybdopterin synthase catalytic subunit
VRVQVRAVPFDPWQVLAELRPECAAGAAGATAVFVGTVRDSSHGEAVSDMTLEHYPGMTERHLERISAEARRRWDLLDTLIVHRVGELRPEDPIVLVAVWSAHRAAALEACRYLIDELKCRAPFWKKETMGGGQRWVEPEAT